MPCYTPLTAYRTPHGSDSAITFNANKALNRDNPLSLPCGRCTGCRLERSRQWAVRCMHEAQLHQNNCFITLTFNKESLPTDYSVDVRHLQLFYKRFRKSLPNTKIRYFACGEYGEENLRPHYHSVVFNYDFPDKKFYKFTPQKNILYTSQLLTNLWQQGHCTTAAVTFQSAAYTARYNMESINGEHADAYYTRQHPDNKTFNRVKPEFIVMSRRPGIGATWLERFQSDVYPSDEVIVNGHATKPPRFYDQQLTEEELEKIKRRRAIVARPYRDDNTPARLRVREAVKRAQIRSLKRIL
ncbi:MAG: replication initiator protein [Microvirus sp.]|nr:MAG: replication initiator protein [Microvirus sp.]